MSTPLWRLAELNVRAEDPALWNDPEAAQKLMRERTQLESRWERS
jgi:peptide chain release factor 2